MTPASLVVALLAWWAAREHAWQLRAAQWDAMQEHAAHERLWDADELRYLRQEVQRLGGYVVSRPQV